MDGRHERNQFANEKRKADSGSQKRGHVPIIQKGQEFDVVIDELGHKGDGIAKLEGYTVFVKNTEVGESVKIKLIKVMDTVAFGERLN